MLDEDQAELRKLSDALSRHSHTSDKLKLIEPVARHCQQRIKTIEELMHQIELPIHSNIGADGSEAIVVMALHSNTSSMQRVVRFYETAYEKFANDIDPSLIPLLKDRIAIIETKKQVYGTMWLEDKDGKLFLPPIIDFEQLNSRLNMYRLKPLLHPRDKKNGKHRKASHKDQRTIPEDIYIDNFAFMDTDLISEDSRS